MQVFADLGENRRPSIEGGPVEEAAPLIGSPFHEEEIVRREADRGTPLEEGVEPIRGGKRLAVEKRRAPLRPDLDRDLPDATGPLEVALNARSFGAEADELGEPCRTKRPQRAEKKEPLQEVCLPLPVRSNQHR
jgi:hypothetical protein